MMVEFHSEWVGIVEIDGFRHCAPTSVGPRRGALQPRQPVTYGQHAVFVSHLLREQAPGRQDTKTAGRIAIGCLVVEIDGFEPTTPCLQSRCSSQLSYTPK